jgi:hypothetical protein
MNSGRAAPSQRTRPQPTYAYPAIWAACQFLVQGRGALDFCCFGRAIVWPRLFVGSRQSVSRRRSCGAENLCDACSSASEAIRPKGFRSVRIPSQRRGHGFESRHLHQHVPDPTEDYELVNERVGAKPVPCPECLLTRQVNRKFEYSRVREDAVGAIMGRWRSLCLSLPSGSVSPLVR